MSNVTFFSNVDLIYAHHLKPATYEVRVYDSRKFIKHLPAGRVKSKTVLKDSLTYNHQQHHHHHPKHHHPHHHQTPFTPNGSYTKHHLHQTSFFTKHLFFSHTFSFAFRKVFFPSVFLFRIKPSGLKLPVPGKPGTPGVPGDRATGRRGVAGTMP